MTKLSKIVLASIAACICLEGCVPPPNGGRVTGTELRDLFFSNSTNQQNAPKPKHRKTLDEIIAEINNGADIKTIVNDNLSTLAGNNRIVTKDEFGNNSSKVSCKIIEVQNKTGKDEIFKYFTSALIRVSEYPNRDGGNGTAMLSGMASGTVQRMIMDGTIPSSVSFTGTELEYLGRDFKSSYSVNDLMVKVMQYLYRQGGETSRSRNYLVSSFLYTNGKLSFSSTCDSVVNNDAMLTYILNSKNPTALKFLGALLSGDEHRATNILMSNPAVKDTFNEMMGNL